MYSDWLISVACVAANRPTGVCGGFRAFPNGMHKNILGWFSRITGKRNESPLDLSTSGRTSGVQTFSAQKLYYSGISCKNKKDQQHHLFFFSRTCLMTRLSGATPGARVVPSTPSPNVLEGSLILLSRPINSGICLIVLRSVFLYSVVFRHRATRTRDCFRKFSGSTRTKYIVFFTNKHIHIITA